MHIFKHYIDSKTLLLECARSFLELGTSVQKSKPFFQVLLSGGKTPALFHQALVLLSKDSALDWARTQIFISDERLGPKNHAESNYKMIFETLIAPLYIPDANVYKIDERKLPEIAASEYQSVLNQVFKTPLPSFDLAILGFGLDGHVASLFPGRNPLHEKELLVVGGGKGPEGRERVTLTFPAINAAKNVWLVSLGAEKLRALNLFLNSSLDVWNCPLMGVRPMLSPVVFWVEETA